MKKLIYIAILLQLSISSLLLADPNDFVYFADSNLETIVAATLTVTPPITEGQMENLYSLTANSMGISDLTGLEYATNLNTLYLTSNLISDPSPISALTSLTNLHLNNNQITDISAVSSLVNLDTLFLSINLINDISPVSGLTGLTNLYLQSNQIIDISSTSGLSNLTVLDLTNNQVVDISTVSNLMSLEYLYLTNNQISNISGLLTLGNLISLLLSQNPLNSEAYCINLHIIRDNNPGLITLTYDPNPNPCFHDECSNAIEITKYEIYSGSTVGATGTEESSCGQWDYLDVWHSYTSDSNEVVDISLCESHPLDTTLVIYDSCGGTELACSDDYCGSQTGLQSQVTLDLTAGKTYLIRVSAYDAETGNYELTITDAPTPPASDICDNAVEVPYAVPSIGSSLEATGTDITSCTTNDTRDVWYYFIPTISGRYLMDLNGSDYDTSLAVFDGCGGTELECNDDYYPDPDYVSRIIVSLVEGETYYIRISGYNGGGGNYSLMVTLAPDINKDGVVDIIDLSWLAQEWMQTGTSDADIAPKEADGGGDTFIDLLDFAEFFKQWLANTLL